MQWFCQPTYFLVVFVDFVLLTDFTNCNIWPPRIRDTATYEEPYSYPVGIEYIIVNGKITVEKGKHKGTLNGKVLRKTAQ